MDKYEMIRLVGKGAYGLVYLYKNKINGKEIIIKKIPANQLNPAEIQYALNEAEVLKMLTHSNIIQYYESFMENDSMVISMEYAPGGTLNQYLIERNGSLLPEKRVLHLFAQIVLALHQVHSKNILHRDLKTANILLDQSKNIVKLGDFGISIILFTRSQAETIVGTPCYLSPEQCEGKKYNKKSDMWSLGCILYEMVTLKRAFDGDSLPSVVLKIMEGVIEPIDKSYSKKMWNLIKSLIHINPESRYTTERVMAEPIMFNAITDLYTDIGRIPLAN
ncbi:Serine/threonine-protein kinase Nek8 [Chamberlinius hualienensis]